MADINPQDGDPAVVDPPVSGEPTPPVDPNAAPPADPNKPGTPPAAPDPNAPPPPADETPDDRPEDVRFWEPVLAEHGITDEMANEIFGETERLTPDAVRVYGNKLIQLAAEAMEMRWREEDPRAYAYRLHRRNGGSDEDFLNTKTSVLPDQEALAGDINLQKSYWRGYLMRSGLDEDQANVLVDDASRKGNLKDKALAAYGRDAQQEQTLLQQIDQQNQAAEQELDQAYTYIDSRINEIVEKGEGLKIAIPAAQRAGFREFIESKLVHDGRNFMFELPINPGHEDFQTILQGLFLMYNRADMSKMIIRKPNNTTPTLRAVGKVVPPVKNEDTTPPEQELTVGAILRRGTRKQA